MQVSIENVGKLGRKMTVRLPAAAPRGQVRTRIQEMGRSARLKGFRPGKVPTKVIEQRFGGQIRNEALSEMIGSSFQEAVDQEKLRPAVQPCDRRRRSRRRTAKSSTPRRSRSCRRSARSTSAAWRSPSRSPASSDADIDQMIETLAPAAPQLGPVERAAQAGDMVLFEYSAQGEGFRHPETGAERVGAILGSDAIARRTRGRSWSASKAGDEFNVDVAFPADFRDGGARRQDGQGRASRSCACRKRSLPEVDEAFVASFGIKDGGLAQFREDVRANLERELKGVLMGRLKAGAIEKLVDAHPELDLPQA